MEGAWGGGGGPFFIPERRFVNFDPTGILKISGRFIAKSLLWEAREIAGKRARVPEGRAKNRGVQRRARGDPPGAPEGARSAQRRARGPPGGHATH